MHRRAFYKNATTQSTQTFVHPNWINPYGVMHGGEMMRLMDEAAGMASTQYVHKKCVTGAVHGLRFFNPIAKNDLLHIYATIVHYSRSTYTVSVWVYHRPMLSETDVEDSLAAHGWFTMVCVDEKGQASSVIPLRIETEIEKMHFEFAREIVAFSKSI